MFNKLAAFIGGVIGSDKEAAFPAYRGARAVQKGAAWLGDKTFGISGKDALRTAATGVGGGAVQRGAAWLGDKTSGISGKDALRTAATGLGGASVVGAGTQRIIDIINEQRKARQAVAQ